MPTGLWYCPTCGYEIRSRGGKCHNCKEPLIESPLEELVPGEAEDEVGYNLDEWEDSARGELIEALVIHGHRHRFEGDELVVAAEDEEEVDRLIAELGSGGELGDPDDPGPGEVLTKLADAAQRLVADPTDMVADGDVAEASAGVFAFDAVYGVDEESWAAVGRVTRRLLGALGADEALEEEISENAALLSRLLKDLEGKVRGFGASRAAPVDTPIESSGQALEASGEAPVHEPNEGEGADVTPSETAEPPPTPENEMVYELEDWRPEDRAQVSLLLERDGVPYQWEGSDLVVGEVHDDAVEAVLAEVRRSGDTPSSDVDDETRYLLLSDLFGAADRLAGDPENEQKRQDLVTLATMIQTWPTPFAVSDDEWWKIRLRAADLAESIDHNASRTVVEDSAANLRDQLRKFV